MKSTHAAHLRDVPCPRCQRSHVSRRVPPPQLRPSPRGAATTTKRKYLTGPDSKEFSPTQSKGGGPKQGHSSSPVHTHLQPKVLPSPTVRPHTWKKKGEHLPETRHTALALTPFTTTAKALPSPAVSPGNPHKGAEPQRLQTPTKCGEGGRKQRTSQVSCSGHGRPQDLPP